MGIGTDIIRFFEVTNGRPYQGQYAPRSLNEFIHQYPQYIVWDLWPIVQRLEHQGHLWFIGMAKESPILQPWLNAQYFSQFFLEADMSYGTFDFAALGFPEIRRHFHSSVVAIHVTKKNGEEDTGTGFLLENRCIVTAKHCIQSMQSVSIDGWDVARIPLKHIWTFKDERVSHSQRDKRPDLALLEFDGDPYPGIPGFQLKEAQILDDVLTMGYPHILGFPPVLISETAQIAASLKSTVGQVVAQEISYLDDQQYLLISARVKGGNSGGPVIGRDGKVVGVVAQLSAEAEGRLDLLGYGVVIPNVPLKQLL